MQTEQPRAKASGPSSLSLRRLQPRHLAWAMILLCFASLSLSKALLSISTGGLLVAGLWQGFQNKNLGPLRHHPLAPYLISIFGLALLAGAWTEDSSAWFKDLREKLPFLVIPFSLALLPAFDKKMKDSLFLTYIIVHTLMALITLGIFFQDYQQGIYDISKNKSIMILGGISHIYFGLFLSFSFFLSLYLYFIRKKEWPRGLSLMVLILAMLDGICLHLLTSRTGLVAFYGTAGIGLLHYIWINKAWLKGGLLLLLLLLLPIVSYYSIPSFKKRVEVTFWDINETQNPDRNLSELSVGTRFATWQTSWEIFLAHPFLGVGKGDLGAEMDEQYLKNGIAARSTNPSHEPHNQYLNQAATTGILGLAILGILIFQYISFFRRSKSFPFLLFSSLVLIGMLFESILERQVGMSFFLIFSMMLSPSSSSLYPNSSDSL